MTLDLTVTDLFCGAGGSSEGAVAAGATVTMGANHWPLATQTYGTNHPNARVDCADVSQVDPRRYPSSDILLASPECTTHSIAQSRKHTPNLFDPDSDPSVERSRATMWDVPRFAEQHRYRAIVVENVLEILKWAPFDAWLAAMDSYGYSHRVVSINSMTARPTPQSRDRVYVVFWQRGDRTPDLEFRPECWCAECECVVEGIQTWNPSRAIGKYRQQYRYRCSRCSQEAMPMISPALTAIDWSLPCPRIGDRKRPLAEATMRRVAVGLERYGMPVIAQKSGHTFERPGYTRSWPVSEPIKTQMGDLQHGVAVPAWMVPVSRGSDESKGPRGMGQPWPTQTGRAEWGISGLLPFVAELRGGGSDVRSVGAPLSTVTASGNHHGLVIPFYVKQYGKGDDPSMLKPVGLPLGAVTTQDHHGVVTVPFVASYHRGSVPKPVTQPLTTQETTDRHAVVLPGFTVEDCGFRMLEAHEVQAAMAFAPEYVVLGNKREKVRQLGNAVTPPVMDMIVRRVIEALS